MMTECHICNFCHPFNVDHCSLVLISSYWAGGGAYSSAALRQMATNIYFPKTDAVTFEQANASQIICKYGFVDVSLQATK